MTEQNLEVTRGPTERQVRTEAGDVLDVPAGWVLLPPGDAGLTRRVKKAGPTWAVKERRGRKLFSRGMWAPADIVSAERAAIEVERADPAYGRRLEASRRRREAKQAVYAQQFEQAVLQCLDFHLSHQALASRLATAIAAHAVPVGSGTVARTERIPIERRAEAAVIAWLRHQTTEYDDMRIPRVKGMRREVRRMLAERSRRLLARYRSGAPAPDGVCLLSEALRTGTATG